MRAETKVRHWGLVLQLVLVFAVILGGAAFLTLGSLGHWVLVGCLFAACMTAAWVYEHWRWRLWRAVCEADFLLCLNCEHDLRGIGERGACPECGERFILSQTKAAWMDARGDEGPDEDSAG